MKEIAAIIAEYDKNCAKGLSMALATVIHVEDSSYRRSGARMLVTEDGTWTGGISGGCLEGDTLKKSRYVIHEQRPQKIRYDTRDGDINQIGVGLGCNGLIDILISPIQNLGQSNQVEILRKCLPRRIVSILLTVINSGNSSVQEGAVYDYTDLDLAEVFVENYEIHKELLTKVETVISSKRSQLVSCGKSWSIFVELMPPSINLLVFGKNYDVIPLAELAKSLGWTTNVVAPLLKVSRQLFDVVDNFITSDKDLPVIDDHTAVLLMSHDYKTDLDNFMRIYKPNLKYIGILGPAARREKLFNDLGDRDIVFDISNIFAPMGLDTGATTPEEIALSILAEIRTCIANREGGMLRDRKTRIND